MVHTPDRHVFREVLAGLAAKTLTRIPALNGRVEKACALVLSGDVELHADGTALVGSLTDPTRAYQVTGSPATCQCRDFDHAPEHLCCHRLAVGFTRKVQELLPTPAPAAPAPLGEAPASCNVYVNIGGHRVQVTLRDRDEHRMLARLEALLQRYPATPPATSPASPVVPVDATPQCPTHGALKKSAKGKGWYCPTRLDDDTWCPSKAK
jgi:hypothetical protein